MKPKEFVARVIDLFEFNMGDGWNDVQPKNFVGASLCISMGLVDKSRTINGYTFVLESQDCLGHTVIRATMLNGVDKLRGSICFTYQEYDTYPTMDDVPLHEHIHEAWDVCRPLRDKPEEIASMLTFLTLKTSYVIRHKRFPS